MKAPWERGLYGNRVVFEPASLTLAASLAAVAAAGVSAVGAIQSGEAQKKAGAYNAQVAENNAAQAQQAAAFNEAQQRTRSARVLGAERAAQGASGVTVEGSPLEVLAQTAQESELDALSIRYGGDVAAARARSEATLARFQGGQAVTSSYFSAGASLLGGASKFGQIYGRPVAAPTSA